MGWSDLNPRERTPRIMRKGTEKLHRLTGRELDILDSLQIRGEQNVRQIADSISYRPHPARIGVILSNLILWGLVNERQEECKHGYKLYSVSRAGLELFEECIEALIEDSNND